MRLSFPPQNNAMRRARGLLTHLHKKRQLWGEKSRLCLIYVGSGSIPRSSDPLVTVTDRSPVPVHSEGHDPERRVHGKRRHRT